MVIQSNRHAERVARGARSRTKWIIVLSSFRLGRLPRRLPSISSSHPQPTGSWKGVGDGAVGRTVGGGLSAPACPADLWRRASRMGPFEARGVVTGRCSAGEPGGFSWDRDSYPVAWPDCDSAAGCPRLLLLPAAAAARRGWQQLLATRPRLNLELALGGANHSPKPPTQPLPAAHHGSG